TEMRAVISGEDVWLTRWGHGEYNGIRAKATAGNPDKYALFFETDAVTAKFHPVPAGNITIKYSYARAIDEIDDPSSTVDLPEMWLETAYVMLAARMATMFGATRVDPAMVENVRARAAELEAAMYAHDKPA